MNEIQTTPPEGWVEGYIGRCQRDFQFFGTLNSLHLRYNAFPNFACWHTVQADPRGAHSRAEQTSKVLLGQGRRWCCGIHTKAGIAVAAVFAVVTCDITRAHLEHSAQSSLAS